MKSALKIAALAVFGFSLAGCATTQPGQYSPTDPNSIRIIPTGGAPYCQNYATLSTVSASTLNATGLPRSQYNINQSLRLQAASLGATGVKDVHLDGNQLGGTAIRCPF